MTAGTLSLSGRSFASMSVGWCLVWRIYLGWLAGLGFGGEIVLEFACLLEESLDSLFDVSCIC